MRWMAPRQKHTRGKFLMGHRPCYDSRSLSHRTRGRGIYIFRVGREWGSCLTFISRGIYFQHAWIPSPPQECQQCSALPTLHYCAVQAIYRESSHSASSVSIVLCFASSVRGLQSCRDGNRNGRNLRCFSFLYQDTLHSSRSSFPSQGQVSLWQLKTFLQ